MICVIGAGGHARVVIDTIISMGHQVRGLYDENPELWGNRVLGVPILGPPAAAEGRGIIAIGDNRIRKKVAMELQLEWITAVHPSAIISASSSLGDGSAVFAGAVIQAEAKIGEHCIVNTSSSIDHECHLEAFSQVGPGAHLGGRVTLREGAFVGLGASVIQGITLESWSTVGAGAVAIRDIEENQTFVGVPAKPIVRSQGNP